MRRKVLLAEQADATRTVAETILRQNGFEVISVPDPKQAVQLFETTQPDLLLIGSELTHNDQPLYQLARTHASTAGKPLLVFVDAGQGVGGIPQEMTIPRPFNPREFLERVMVFSGQKAGVRTDQRASGEDEVDAALDQAFGQAPTGDTSSIEVTDSEVMGGTTKITRRKRGTPDGSDYVSPSDDDEMRETGRVESIRIEEDQTDIRRPATGKVPTRKPSESGGLDILNDQYGLTQPGAAADPGQAPERAEHDFNWFMNELQREVNEEPQSTKPGSGKSAADKGSDDELSFTDPSSTLEPFKMPQEEPAKTPPKQDPPVGKKVSEGGVEKFIDEFKREIEKFETDETESITLREEQKKAAGGPDWEESLEQLTPERMQLFTRQLASDLADKIAARIISKLDADKLLQLIKAEILARLGNPEKQ